MRRLLKISSRVIFVSAIFFVWDMLGASVPSHKTIKTAEEYSISTSKVTKKNINEYSGNKILGNQPNDSLKSVWKDESMRKPWRHKSKNNSMFPSPKRKINKNAVSLLGLSKGNVESLLKIVDNGK